MSLSHPSKCSPLNINIATLLFPISNTFFSLKSAVNFINPVVGFCGYFDTASGLLHKDADMNGMSKGIPLKLSEAEVESVVFRSIDWLSNPANLQYANFCVVPSTPFTGATSVHGRSPPRATPKRSPSSLRYTMPIFGGPPEVDRYTWPRIWGLTGLITYQTLCGLLPNGLPAAPKQLPDPFTKYFQ